MLTSPFAPESEPSRAAARHPELERDQFCGFMRYLEHGFPDPLVRWHCHDEYEIHLIVATHGKVFVGDYIGEFSPGQLILTGPGLPHNWISSGVPSGGVPLRDRAVQFAHAPLEAAMRGIPELQDVRPLLERAKFGIEFFGLGDIAEKHLLRLRDSTGLERFAEFTRLLGRLARATDYRLLSTAQLKGQDDDVEAVARVNSVVNFIAENYREELSAKAMSERLQMSPSQFARFFRRATGNGFIDFVTRIRVNKACQLLMDTDLYVADICREVGFHNLANFNRRFLELKGLTPREFRRNAQERFKGA